MPIFVQHRNHLPGSVTAVPIKAKRITNPVRRRKREYVFIDESPDDRFGKTQTQSQSRRDRTRNQRQQILNLLLFHYTQGRHSRQDRRTGKNLAGSDLWQL
jgi:hypothetical protein